MLPEEISKYIGMRSSARVMEVEKGAIRRFAESVGNTNPLFTDDEYARNSKYGSIISVPGFFGWPAGGARSSGAFQASADLNDAITKAGMTHVLNGGTAFEYFLPIRAGDILAATSEIKEIQEAEGSLGKMYIVITETTYLNQNGDMVALSRSTGIRY